MAIEGEFLAVAEVYRTGDPSLARNSHSLAILWPICESLYAQEGVLLYQDHITVPSSLRSRVMQNLHTAHQGTSTMKQRAQAIIYWPGMSTDIRNTRDGCAGCNRNAPTQAATPPIPTMPPSTVVTHIFGACNFICSRTHPPLLFPGLGPLFLFILLFSQPILLNLARGTWCLTLYPV